MVGAATKFNASPPEGTAVGSVFEQVKPLGSEPRVTIAVELLLEAFTRIENVLPGVAVSDELCNESDRDDDEGGGGFVPPVVPPPQETMSGNNRNTNELKITEKYQRLGRKILSSC